MGSQEVEFITSMNVIIATVRNCSIDNHYMRLKRVLDLKDKVLRFVIYFVFTNFNVRVNLKNLFNGKEDLINYYQPVVSEATINSTASSCRSSLCHANDTNKLVFVFN